jgi:predicted ATPase
MMLAGRFALSRWHLEAGLALYDPMSHHSLAHQAGFSLEVVSQGILGIVLFCLGFPNQALAQSNAAIAEARRLAHPPSLGSTLSDGAVVLALIGDSVTLNEWADEMLALASDQGFPYFRALGTLGLGWARIMKGDVTAGISLLRIGSTAYRASGAEAWTPYCLALLARACEITGQIEECLTLLDDALRIVESTGERWFEAELCRHKGQLLLRQGHDEAAEEQSRKALSIAREQGAKLWELRAAVSLGSPLVTRPRSSNPLQARASTASSHSATEARPRRGAEFASQVGGGPSIRPEGSPTSSDLLERAV